MEFQSTQKKTAPQSHVCVIYDPHDGRIVHGHVFVGEGTGLFGPEGVTSANARRSRVLDATMATSRACASSTRPLTFVSPRTSPIEWTSRGAGWSSATKFRMSGRHENRRRRTGSRTVRRRVR